jgi:hypothetical protein
VESAGRTLSTMVLGSTKGLARLIVCSSWGMGVRAARSAGGYALGRRRRSWRGTTTAWGAGLPGRAAGRRQRARVMLSLS